MPICRRPATVLLAAAMLAVAGCSASPPKAKESRDSVADAVRAAVRTQVDAYAARDADRAASVLAPDVVAMAHGAPDITSQRAAAESMRVEMKDQNLKLAVSDETIDVADSADLAVYRATYRYSYTDPATHRPATEIGNWVAVFKRQADGSMKMSQEIVADTPAKAVAP